MRGIDIAMEVGAGTETIEVDAAVPLLETGSLTVGQFMERDTVFGMPLASRRSASLVRLLGNITDRNEGGAEALPFFSLSSSRSSSTATRRRSGALGRGAVPLTASSQPSGRPELPRAWPESALAARSPTRGAAANHGAASRSSCSRQSLCMSVPPAGS